MSVRDLAFVGKLAAIRRAVRRLPKRLQPTPTCVAFSEAAQMLGLSQMALRRAVRRRRWRTLKLDGKELLPLATVDMLRR